MADSSAVPQGQPASRQVAARRQHRRHSAVSTILRHAGRELAGLRDGKRLLAMALVSIAFAGMIAGFVARGEAAGADARAYWAAVRIWLNGGDPYHPTGPFLPYVYPPWMLPLFAPWALLPWNVAWFTWRMGNVALYLWTFHWAYSRRPLATAVTVAVLAFPFAANIDTGNVNLLLALGLWAAQFSGPVVAGILWAFATWMKWLPAPFWLILSARGRLFGLLALAGCGLLSLLTLPLTIVQFQAIFGFGPRPIRLDYLVFLWALVPWWWRHPEPLWWTRPSAWPGLVAGLRHDLASWQGVRLRIRRFLGLPA